MARILIVEDDADLRLLYRIMLEQKGYEVLDAGTGKQALKVLAFEQIDAVVLDLGLPDNSGLQLIDEIRSQQSQMPIINTGYDFLGEDFRDWGADEVVSKSSGPAVLIRAVARVMPAEFEFQNFEFAPAFHA
jgi:DNA-binding response OmpR family regulator